METPSKSTLKFVKSLGEIKYRRQSGCFKAEGTKCVLDTIAYFEIEMVMATSTWLDKNGNGIPLGSVVYCCTMADMERMTSLSTAPQVIGVYKIPEKTFDSSEAHQNLVLALDTIQDPGNLGTIMRVADWFGVKQIVCSRETVDVYNPKTIQSTMGAISRVAVTYQDLPTLLGGLKEEGVEICGTFLDGDNIYSASTLLPRTGVIVVGNEGRGISEEVAAIVSKRLTIPSYPVDAPTSESLNAAIATAVTLSTFRQKLNQWQKK